MDLEALKQWRRQRMEALAQRVGGNAELGRLLGYRDGAFVGQMIKGTRPITEATVHKAESLRHERLGISGARGWFALEDVPPPGDAGEQSEFRERPPTLEEAMEALGEAILGMDDVGREMAGTLLTSLVKHPEKAHSLAETLAAFAQLRKRTATDPDPQPPKPAKVKVQPKADAKRPGGRAALVLKIGGGEKRQYELQLRRDAFRPASTVSAKEAEWYERLRATPKAANG